MSNNPNDRTPHSIVRAISFILLPIALALFATQGLQLLDNWWPQSVISTGASQMVSDPVEESSASASMETSVVSLPASSESQPELLPSNISMLPASSSSQAQPSVPSLLEEEQDGSVDTESLAAVVEDDIPLQVGQELLVPSLGYGKVIYEGEQRGKGKVALTFDSGWLFEPTETLLAVLRDKNVTATFFLRGGWIEANPDLVRLIYAEGHEIGNHSYTHGHLPEMSAEEVQAELASTRQALYDVLGPVAQPYYRPPYGEYNDRDVQEAGSLGFRYTVMWSVDSIDWMDPGEEEILTRVGHNLQDGGIALMHVGVWQTANILPQVIDALRDRELEPVPLSELILWEDHLEAYTVDTGDTWSDIAIRYAISVDFLKQLNGVRHSQR